MTAALVQLKQKVAEVGALFEQIKPQLVQALPRHIDPRHIIRVAMTSVQRSANLALCTRRSLAGALIECAQLGLEPDGILGHAYLVPLKNKGVHECQLWLGYKGLVKLAYRSRHVLSVAGRVVHEKDEFDYALGLSEFCRHRPFEGPEPGGVRYAYGIGRTRGGGQHFELLTVHEIETIRKRAPSARGRTSPWDTHYDEMARKTVIRRLCKFLPTEASPELARATALDELAESGIPQGLDANAPGNVDPPDQRGALDLLAEQPKDDEPPPGVGRPYNVTEKDGGEY